MSPWVRADCGVVLRATEANPVVPLAFGTTVLLGAGSAVFTLFAELQDKVGFATWGFGVMAGAYFVAQFFAQTMLARLADSGEARKLLVSAVVLSAISLVWFAFAPSLAHLIAARVLGGIASGCWLPSARAIAVAGRGDKAGEQLGKLAVGETGGIVVGPLAASGLVALFDLTATYLIWAAIVSLLIVLALAVPISESDERTVDSPSPLQLLRRRPVAQAAVLSVALFAPIGVYESVWPKYIDDIGGSTFVIAISIAAYGLPYMLVAPLGGRIGDRYGPKRVALVGTVGLAIVTFGVGAAPSLGWVMVIGVVEACISAIAYPNALAAMARACDEDELATGQGLAGGASIGVAGMMAIVAGPIYAASGAFWTFTVAGAAVLVFGAIARSLGDGEPARAGSAGQRPFDEVELKP